MNRIILVAQHEVITTLRRTSFVIFSFVVPLGIMLVFFVLDALGGRLPATGQPAEPQTDAIRALGYVDEAGLIRAMPEDVPPDLLRAYPDEAAARSALESGQIDGYYLIPGDYMQAGEVIFIYPEPNLFALEGQHDTLRRVLLVNMLGGDARLAARVWNPASVETVNLSAQGSSVEADCTRPGDMCDSSPLMYYLPTIMLVMFFVFTMTASGLVLWAIVSEKQNRTIEVLMMSITPHQMLVGKIAGLGIVGLLQMAVWLGAGYLMLAMGGRTLNLPGWFSVDPLLLVWGVVFFLLGYVLYASLMAGVGAMASSLKESSQATWAVIWPLFAAYMVGSMMGNQGPHTPLMVALSLFPLSAPVLMMQRLTAGGVPLWQPVLAAVLMAATSAWTVRMTASLFRAQALLSGRPFSVRSYYRALLGRG